MASVLTNPLLARNAVPKRPEFDVTTAKAEIKGGADPLNVLENYEQKGYATIELGQECVRAYQQTLQGLDHKAQMAQIQKHEAGKRVLQWLWRSECFRSAKFVDDPAFMDQMVLLVMLEGLEDFLWQWIVMDMKLAARPNPYYTSKHKQELDDYRWKGRLLRGMVIVAFGPPHKEARSADEAIRIFARARELKKSALRGRQPALQYIPTSPAHKHMISTICRGGMPYRETSPHAFDALIKALNTSDENLFLKLGQAELMLFHPTKPSPDLSYRCFERAYSDDESRSVVQLRTVVRSSDERTRFRFFMQMIRTAVLLRARGDEAKAEWILERAKEQYPRDAERLDKRIEDVLDERSELRRQESAPVQARTDDMPFPAFT